jgi:hypothetical protein
VNVFSIGDDSIYAGGKAIDYAYGGNGDDHIQGGDDAKLYLVRLVLPVLSLRE